MLRLDVMQEYIYGDIEVSRANRAPCIVCGHPTGDCRGESPAPTHIIGEEFYATGTRKAPPQAKTFLVPEDVWLEVYLFGETKTRVLVAAKGSTITLDEARKHGFIT